MLVKGLCSTYSFLVLMEGTYPTPSPMCVERTDLFLDAPITVTSLLNDVTVPPMLQCNQLLARLVAAHVLYAHGNTSSYLHRDGYDNLLMVLAGEKRVLLLNSTDAAAAYADDHRAVLKGMWVANNANGALCNVNE